MMSTSVKVVSGVALVRRHRRAGGRRRLEGDRLGEAVRADAIRPPLGGEGRLPGKGLRGIVFRNG
jgi:hypothetical protein